MAEEGENAGRERGPREPFFSGDSSQPTGSYGEQGIGPGAGIGPFKLLGVLGEGGYGIVYLAEQERPIRRRVALKVIKPGMDSKQVIARFEAERQALALLDHPNIAQIYDAGATIEGRPYFAMEYVEGLPITEHCDREKLSLKERLQLFLQVCEAVKHAHQKGIIHRDLKPSNLLVMAQDDEPLVKVIDFGIAKALAQPLTEQTLYTEQGQLIGTPDYMSPEQAEMDARGVDTRSDVYSLGVVLYELLTGVLPFDPDDLRAGGVDHIRAVIRDQEPRTPSTRLTGMGEGTKAIAERRRTDGQALAKSLRRELEWIPLKAMRKESPRRYQSVSELADDIENYLHDRPLHTGPESVLYRARKLVQRHRAAVAGAAVVAASLLIGLIASTLLYSRAEKMRVIAEDSRQATETARAAEATQRQAAERERDRVVTAEQQLQRQLAVLYEQRGRSCLASGRLDEALVFLNEAYQLDGARFSARLLLSDATRRWRDSQGGGHSAVTPWRIGDSVLDPCGYATSPDRSLVAFVDSREEYVYIFETRTGRLITRFSARGTDGMVFTPDAQHVILRSRRDNGGKYRVLAISMNPERLIVDCEVDDQSQRVDRLCELTSDYVPSRNEFQKVHNSIYLSRSGRWLALPFIDLESQSTSIRLFDLLSQGRAVELTGSTLPAKVVAFSPDERFLGTFHPGRGQQTYAWEIGTARPHADAALPFVLFTTVSPDSQFGLRLYEFGALYSGTQPRRIWWNSSGGEFSPNGTRFITKQVGPVDPQAARTYPPGVLWDTASVTPVAELTGREVVNWYFSVDSRVLVTEHTDGELKVWNCADGAQMLAIPAEENRLVADVSPDGRWLLTSSSIESRTVKLWDLSTGASAEVPIGQSLGRDLTAEWLSKSMDRIFRTSYKVPTGLPRFNEDGSKLITRAGLQDISFAIFSPEEANAWVKAHIATRWDGSQLRLASTEEMLDARIKYATINEGPEDPCTLSLRIEKLRGTCEQYVAAERLEEIAQAVAATRALIPGLHASFEEAVSKIHATLGAAYFQRGERSERHGRFEAALADYEASLRVDGTQTKSLVSLASLYATARDSHLRDGARAAAYAKKACELTTRQDAYCLGVLAAAYAEAGSFDRAVSAQIESLRLLGPEERPRWEANFEQRLRLYQARRRYDNASFWNVPTEHLIAWWKLDDQTGQTAADSSGYAHHGTIVGDANWVPGHTNGAISLRAGREALAYVRCGVSARFNITNAMTLSGWMKVSQFTMRHEPLVTKGDSSWGLRRWADTGRMQFVLSLPGGGGVPPEYRGLRGRTNVEDGLWHHICGVYDGREARLYVDGILDVSAVATGSIPVNDYEVTIGQSAENYLTRQWNGLIDDVRIYDRALGADEVVELYYSATGTSNGPPVVRVARVPCVAWPDSAVRLHATVIDDGQPFDAGRLRIAWSCRRGPRTVEFRPSSDVEDPLVVFPQPGAYVLSIRVSDGEKTVTADVSVGVYPAAFDGLLARYSFDDGMAQNTSSLDGLETRLVGNARVTDEARRARVLHLADDGYVDCGSDPRLDLTDGLTVATWIKVDNFGLPNQRLVARAKAWELSRHADTGRIRLQCHGIIVAGDRPGFNSIVGETSVSDGTWHQVTGVVDTRELRLYVDGKLDINGLIGPGELNPAGDGVTVGDSRGTGSSELWLDDVRIYNRALSSEEVACLYDKAK